jgi:hypothetical protein
MPPSDEHYRPRSRGYAIRRPSNKPSGLEDTSRHQWPRRRCHGTRYGDPQRQAIPYLVVASYSDKHWPRKDHNLSRGASWSLLPLQRRKAAGVAPKEGSSVKPWGSGTSISVTALTPGSACRQSASKPCRYASMARSSAPLSVRPARRPPPTVLSNTKEQAARFTAGTLLVDQALGQHRLNVPLANWIFRDHTDELPPSHPPLPFPT